MKGEAVQRDNIPLPAKVIYVRSKSHTTPSLLHQPVVEPGISPFALSAMDKVNRDKTRNGRRGNSKYWAFMSVQP